MGACETVTEYESVAGFVSTEIVIEGLCVGESGVFVTEPDPVILVVKESDRETPFVDDAMESVTEDETVEELLVTKVAVSDEVSEAISLSLDDL